ncbi:MAG TPA: hypothetical protein VEA63_16880 [Opitutus sp.]|nr:hypothetical protein [Opitutus sp.]
MKTGKQLPKYEHLKTTEQPGDHPMQEKNQQREGAQTDIPGEMHQGRGESVPANERPKAKNTDDEPTVDMMKPTFPLKDEKGRSE